MNFDEYQEMSRKTAIYPKIAGHGFIYPVMGLAGEAGEVSEKFKKVLRDEDGILSEAKKAEVAKELGDVLWYVTQIASELNLKMSDIAQANINKLYSRRDRGALGGSGDNR